jgi:hypothetical protein
VVRERQGVRVRYEVSGRNPDGSDRGLAVVFSTIERARSELDIAEYAISQTSLEQVNTIAVGRSYCPSSDLLLRTRVVPQ